MTATTNRPPSQAKLTNEQVYFVLTDNTCTMQQLADRFGVSSSTVQKVISGKAYAHLFPEIPRKQREPVIGPRCNQCVHDHNNKCSLGFPERNRSGGDTAAVTCAAFATGRLRLYDESGPAR